MFPTQASSLALALIAALQAFLIIAPAAQARPERAPAKWQTSINKVFGDQTTMEAVTDKLQAPPARCLPLGTSSQLCEWNLGRDQPSWKPIAKALKTRSRVSLICRVEQGGLDSTPSGKSACSARPMASNRRMFSPNKFKRDWEREQKEKQELHRETTIPRPRWKNREIRKALRQEAMSWLNAARNLEELSRLLGALPTSCKPAGDEMQRCMWRTSASTYGHGTVAAAVPVDGSKKVDLICNLPTDGRFRTSGASCSFEPES